MDATPDGGGASLDELFAILAHERRRRVLRYFRDRDDVADVDELADHVVSQSDRIDDVDRVALALHHGDLPRLADAGIVEYDPRSTVARFRGDERLSAICDAVNASSPDRDVPSCRER